MRKAGTDRLTAREHDKLVVATTMRWGMAKLLDDW